MLWPCDMLGVLTSETRYSTFLTQAKTQACHGRVKDTGHRHGCMSGRVKTPVSSNLEFTSHGLGAWACPLVLRPCEPYGPSARPCHNGHTGVCPVSRVIFIK